MLPNSLLRRRTGFLCYLVLCVFSTLYLFSTKGLGQTLLSTEIINYVATNFSRVTSQGSPWSDVNLDIVQINVATKPEVTNSVKSISNFHHEVKNMTITASVTALHSSANATSFVKEPEQKVYVELSNRSDASRTTVWRDNIGGGANSSVGATQTALFLSSHAETFSDFSHFARKPKATLPTWLEDYVIWHANTLRLLNTTNWQSQRYLVARCLKSDKSCGGTSDRLKSTPFLLRLANLQKRLLFYHWEQPAPLQSFLQPPAGGVNWTIPYWLLPHLNFSEESVIEKTMKGNSLLQQMTERSNQTLIDVRPQTGTGCSEVYNVMLDDNEPSFTEILPDVFSIMFEPSPPVARLIYQHTQDLGLQPGMYTSVHIRALYPTEIDKNSTLMTQNAVKCANQLDPVAAIYVASDSPSELITALQFGHVYLNGRVKVRPTQITLHINLKESTDPEQYYDTFVDLYLIALSKCVSFGAGGFGSWGRDLSFDPRCSIRHNYVTCKLSSSLG